MAHYVCRVPVLLFHSHCIKMAGVKLGNQSTVPTEHHNVAVQLNSFLRTYPHMYIMNILVLQTTLIGRHTSPLQQVRQIHEF